MKTILMIDGNAPFCEALKKIIETKLPGIAIEGAPNGGEGLEKVKALSPHLVFVDIHLTGESGLNLVRKIKALNPNTIVVAFISYDLPEYRSAVRESGVDHLVPKDAWTGEEMLVLVESIMSAESPSSSS